MAEPVRIVKMKIVGWVFIGMSLIGCVLFLSWIADWGLLNDEIMAPQIDGGASNAPIMIGLLAIAGAYLLKNAPADSQ